MPLAGELIDGESLGRTLDGIQVLQLEQAMAFSLLFTGITALVVVLAAPSLYLRYGI